MKKPFMMIILFALLSCTGCESKEPKQEQMIRDVNEYVSEWHVSYTTENSLTEFSPMEEHNPKITSISVEKSLCKDENYEGWLKVNLEDESIDATAYLKVDYLRYDNNNWELQKCEDYQPRVAHYTGEINLQKIKELFNMGSVVIDSIELLNYEKGVSATVKLLGSNSTGYYINSKDDRGNLLVDSFYDGEVDFEATIDFVYDINLLQWRATNVRNASSPTTYVNPEALNYALEQAFIEETKIRSSGTLSLPVRTFSYSSASGGESPILTGMLDNTTGISTLSDSFIFNNESKCYNEISNVFCDVSFGDKFDFTYSINVFINYSDVKGNWSVDEIITDRVRMRIGIPSDDSIYDDFKYHIVYPYNGNTNKALVTAQNVTFDSNGEHILEGVYNAKEYIYGCNGILIEAEIPRCGIEGWDTLDRNIVITYDEIKP